VEDFAFCESYPIGINTGDYDRFKVAEHSLGVSGWQEPQSLALLLPTALNRMMNDESE
jgi:hypothetical protein